MIILPDPVVALFEEQHGVAARFQLKSSMQLEEIDHLVTVGYFVKVQRGVYRVRGSALTPRGVAMAAVLRARPDAVLTGPFVLGLFDIDGFQVGDPFIVLTQPGRRMRNVEFTHRTNPTPDDVIAWRGCLPVVDATAAWVDSAAFVEDLGRRRLRVGYDHARWRGLTSLAKVVDRARRLAPGHDGAALVLDWHEEGVLVPESESERDIGAVFVDFEPRPESQVWILRYRLDWYWRLYRFGLEYFGGIDHAYAEARLADTERFRDLRGAGVRIAPVVRKDLEDLDAFRTWVRSCLVVRAAELGLPPPA